MIFTGTAALPNFKHSRTLFNTITSKSHRNSSTTETAMHWLHNAPVASLPATVRAVRVLTARASHCRLFGRKRSNFSLCNAHRPPHALRTQARKSLFNSFCAGTATQHFALRFRHRTLCSVWYGDLLLPLVMLWTLTDSSTSCLGFVLVPTKSRSTHRKPRPGF